MSRYLHQQHNHILCSLSETVRVIGGVQITRGARIPAEGENLWSADMIVCHDSRQSYATG